MTGAVILALHLLAAQPDAVPPARFAERRQALRDSMGEGIAVLWGEPEEGLRGFRQTSDLLYLTGVEAPGAVLMIVAGPEDVSDGAQPPAEVLFLPRQTDKQARWVDRHLRPGSTEEEKRAAGFEDIRDVESLSSVLRRTANAWRGKGFDLWLDYREGDLDGPLDEDLRRARLLRDRYPQARVLPVRPLLARLRQVKDEDEVRLLRRAIEITGDALRTAGTALEPGMTQMEVRSVVEGAFMARGAPRVGFTSIVGSGPDSTVLHHPAADRVIRKGDLVVVDVGAEVAPGYTADITRTLPAGGRFTPRQREIYELVLRAQAAGFEAVKPGATMADVHKAARAVLEEAGYGEAFWHYTSHWLGLDVHDVGDRNRPLEPGMVLTVEPGIYLPDEEIGVRIEDDVLVTEDGAEVLSSGIFRSVREVERAMRPR